MASVTKTDLISDVSEQAGVSKADAERVLSAFFNHVTTTTMKGDKVGWPGFGTFAATARPARTGRNPQTGEPVKISASTAMRFSASSLLKQALNTNK